MVYVGVDLHRKVSHVVALDEAGREVLSRRFDHSPAAFQRVFGELEPEPISVAFEATYGWGWFADLLADAGIEAHMAHPLATKAVGAGRVKNDAIDAATLAHLLRTNLLPEAWIAPPAVRELRRLVRMRSSLVRIRSRLKCQVHAICADAGAPVPASDLFGRKGRGSLETLELPAITAGRLAAHLRLIDHLGREIVTADREIVAAFKGDDRVRRLLPIPGIGILTAATIIAEVGDVTRFPSADRLASWAGLTPKRDPGDLGPAAFRDRVSKAVPRRAARVHLRAHGLTQCPTAATCASVLSDPAEPAAHLVGSALRMAREHAARSPSPMAPVPSPIGLAIAHMRRISHRP